jgi:DNA-binding transcriptional LysR family regulator
VKDWDDYRFMLALDRYGTVTAAAEILGVSTVTVSRHLDSLTSEVGRPLFRYSGGRWIATDVGQALIRIAQSIEEEDKKSTIVVASQDEELKGQVRINSISFINNFFLAEDLDRLMKKHPGIIPLLEATDRTVSFTKGETDISVRLFEPKEVRLIRAPLCKFPVGLYRADRGNDREWVGLPESLDWLPEMRMARDYFGKPPSIRVDSYPGIAKAARISGMVSLIPTCISSYFSGISPIEDVGALTVRDAWCVYHENNRGQRNIAAVVEWIKDVLGSPRGCACGSCKFPET